MVVESDRHEMIVMARETEGNDDERGRSYQLNSTTVYAVPPESNRAELFVTYLLR